MNKMINFVPPFLVAWLITFSLASVFQSQTALNDLAQAGMQLSTTDQLGLMLDDWLGLVSTYGAILIVATLAMFLIASFAAKKLKIEKALTRALFYGVVSIATIAIILFALEPFLDASLSADVSKVSFYTQLLAGLAGGMIFGILFKRGK